MPGQVVAVLVSRNPAARALIVAEALWAARARGLRVGAGELSRRLAIDSARVGRGYGYPTPDGEAAMAAGRRIGLSLDATYTAKAFSRALEGDDDPQISRKKAKVPSARPRRTVYWHTLSDASPEELLKGAPAVDELRRSYAELFILGENQS
jgi:1-aminocyclopropane-1-carboxylate deaminase/D-cysteine desulfhydrase-like pyridoxal-dependent ACC family enzyme